MITWFDIFFKNLYNKNFTIKNKTNRLQMENYKIELEHIRLELIHRRKNNVNSINHLRHFVDQWFCYKYGYITNGNRAAWGKIIFKEYVSEGILKLLEKHTEEDLLNMKGKNRLIVEKEHIMPLNRITKKLLDLPIDPSIEEIEIILTENVKYATITKEEDKFEIIFINPPFGTKTNYKGLNKLFATWKPREPYEFINANQYKKPVLNHNLIY